MARAESPDTPSSGPRCPICLESFTDRSFVDPCFHSYCFTCILQWSEVSTSCPLCKTTYSKIIHSVKANDDYEVFDVRPKAQESSEVSLSEARRFWYRSSVVPGQPAYKRRAQKNRAAAAHQRRRVVYSVGLWVKPLPPEGGKIRIRNISSRFFKTNPASSHRLIPWLTREFDVVVGKKHTEFMVQLVLSLIDKVELESREFATHLSPFLHNRTNHFLHEFISFAKSPYDMIAYDDKCSYDFNHRPQQNMEQIEDRDQPGPSSRPAASDPIDDIWPVLEPYDEGTEHASLHTSSWDVSPVNVVTTTPVDGCNSPINLISPDTSRVYPPVVDEGSNRATTWSTAPSIGPSHPLTTDGDRHLHTPPSSDGVGGPSGHSSSVGHSLGQQHLQSHRKHRSSRSPDHHHHKHSRKGKDKRRSSKSAHSHRKHDHFRYNHSLTNHRHSRYDHSPSRYDHSPTNHRHLRYDHSPTNHRQSRYDRSPFRYDHSPTRRHHSPTNRHHFPTRRHHSFTRNDHSPTRQASSPTRRASSPIRRASSPTRQCHSPTRQASSPTRRASSPTRQCHSPTRRVSSPTRQCHSPTKQGHSHVVPDMAPTLPSSSTDTRPMITADHCSAEDKKRKEYCKSPQEHLPKEEILENELKLLAEQIKEDKKELLKKLLQKEKVQYLKASLNHEEEVFSQTDL